jgi:hypothetical protein
VRPAIDCDHIAGRNPRQAERDSKGLRAGSALIYPRVTSS